MTTLNPKQFVHLRCHTEFSVFDGTIRIEELISKVQSVGMPAIAISDLANLFGFVKFYKGARKLGIKPIAACDFVLDTQGVSGEAHRIEIIATNNKGYLRLCEIISKVWLENEGLDVARLKKEWLTDTSGLITLSGGIYGDIGQALFNKPIEAPKLLEDWVERFPDGFYIELQRELPDQHGRYSKFGQLSNEYSEMAVQLAAKFGVPVVATHPIQFLESDGFDSHDVRVCIAEGEFLSDPKRKQRFSREQYFYSPEQMCKLFEDIPSAITNTFEIAKRCNITLKLGKPQLPIFPTPEGVSVDEYFAYLAKEGLAKRLEFLFPDEAIRKEKAPIYQARLNKEIEVIESMGFTGYFLIVQDFINWGKNNGVPVGPGRGSGAGSLVAYSLGITGLDPLQYDLLFERFLNPERVSMPDFDVDFCQDNREKVIDYVIDKYGEDSVSQIVTFGTLGARAVVKDVGRVMQVPYAVCDELSKLIPNSPADPYTLQRALNEIKDIQDLYNNSEGDSSDIKTVVDYSLKIEGLTRNTGTHAGGVLIAPGKLTDFTPLHRLPGSTTAVSQYDKNDIEDVGLVKFDFLGLRNLTILDWTVRYVKEFNEAQKDFDLDRLPLDDKATYKLLSDGNTTAVFQLESDGMKNLLMKLKPSTFEDIVAVLALYRPGPLNSGMVDDFVDRKHGRAKVDYFHKDLESVLKPTYGVIVYQEQVMLISQIIGGYSLGGADILRRAMGKKKLEEMARQREIFQKGAMERGYDPNLATNLFDLMEMFASYGFNKSHSVAYALIAYQTAWLKAYHPAEFMAATMTSDMNDTDKVQIFWEDCIHNGLKLLAPNINTSYYRFEPVKDEQSNLGLPPKTIGYGLGAIKGVGQNVVEEIVKARNEGGDFISLQDLIKRVDRTIVTKRSIEALIKAGAMDVLDKNRALLMAMVDDCYIAANQAEESKNQWDLFADDEGGAIEVSVPEGIEAWTLKEVLDAERESIGFYFSNDLFGVWRSEVRKFIKTPIKNLGSNQGALSIAGVLTNLRINISKNSDKGDNRLIFLTLDDGSETVEVFCPPSIYERYKSRIKKDSLLVVQVQAKFNSYMNKMRYTAECLYDYQTARERWARTFEVDISKDINFDVFKSIFAPYRGAPENNLPGVSVQLNLSHDEDYTCSFRLGDDWSVRLDDALFKKLEQAQLNYKIVY
ncbi:DNA polymerase III subunit alpha [Taylorella equigenitalis]|uniref:DNA polymerase III subunit alpha n=1 Tax=Taylorella equigenitalis TaxID=29575 RepID=UPI00237CA659|nr:DNA polymerase III subunit alpha [Taylorella equigenitalis]WDU54015.1 DNA polymerase III subunit alpha [Taylorella equigenitalis]